MAFRQMTSARGGGFFRPLVAILAMTAPLFAQDARVGWNAIFESGQVFAQGQEPFYAESLDVDGDGDLDIITLSRIDSVLAWQENLNGDGAEWISHIITNDIAAPLNFALADMNRDGFMDIVIGSSGEDRIDWFQHPGTATLDSQWIRHSIYTPPAVPTVPDVTTPTYVAVADMNGDGFLDIVVTSYTDRRVSWFQNLDGIGDSWQRYAISTSARDSLGMAVGDVNDDGHQDVVWLSTFDDAFGILLNDGATTPTFTQRTIQPVPGNPSVVNFPSHAQVADFNGDGRTDIAVVSVLDSRLSLHVNQGGEHPVYTHEDIRIFPPVPAIGTNGLFRAVAFDADRDGDMDIATASVYDGQIAFLENRMNGGLPWQHTTLTTAASGAIHVAAADVDGDGRDDIIGAASYAGFFAWYRNVGGQWSASVVDRVPALCTPGSDAPLASLRIQSFGRAGDESLALESITLGFKDSKGESMPLAQVSGIIERLSIYHDLDFDGTVSLTSDTLVFEGLVPTTEETSLGINLSGAVILPGITSEFLIIAGINANAASAKPSTARLLIDHTTHSITGIETGNTPVRAAGIANFESKRITADGIAPLAPVITGVDPDTGIPNDRLVNIQQVDAVGTGEVGATVLLFRNGAEVNSGPVDANGNWRIAAGPITAGRSTLSARIRDEAGNISPASANAFVTVDLDPPTVHLGEPSSTLTRSGPVTLPVTFSGQNQVLLSPSFVEVDGSGITNYVVSTTSNQVTINNIQGSGMFRVRLKQGAATDNSGNQTASTGYTTDVIVDNTPPSIQIEGPNISRTREDIVIYTITSDSSDAIPSPDLGSFLALENTGTANAVPQLVGAEIHLTSVSGTGTIRPVINAGAWQDILGNPTLLINSANFVTVDQQAPTAEITLNGGGIVVGEPIVLAINSPSEPIKRAEVLARFNDGPWTLLQELTSEPWQVAYLPERTDDLADGVYQFAATLEDDLGNSAQLPNIATAHFNNSAATWYRRMVMDQEPQPYPIKTGQAISASSNELGGDLSIQVRDGLEFLPSNLDRQKIAPLTLLIESTQVTERETTLVIPYAIENAEIYTDVWAVRAGVPELLGPVDSFDSSTMQVTTTVILPPGITILYFAAPDALISGEPILCQ